MRDSQRQRVYNSENAVFSRDGKMTLSQAQEYVDGVTASAWWKHRCRLVKVEVEAGARGGRAWASYGSIRTSPDARCPSVLLHELAHIMTESGVAPHGPEFCANFVAITRQFLGKKTGDELRQAFRERRVKVRGATKPKVVRVQCAKCGKQFSHGTGWRIKQSSVGAVQFCTKRCGTEWFSARLQKV